MPQNLPAGILHLVDVLRRKICFRAVEHYVIALVVCILHRAQQGIRPSAKHHVKGAKAHVALVEHRRSRYRQGGEQFDQQNGGDEPMGDGIGLHSRRYPRPRRVSMLGSGLAASSLRRKFEMWASITLE